LGRFPQKCPLGGENSSSRFSFNFFVGGGDLSSPKQGLCGDPFFLGRPHPVAGCLTLTSHTRCPRITGPHVPFVSFFFASGRFSSVRFRPTNFSTSRIPTPSHLTGVFPVKKSWLSREGSTPLLISQTFFYEEREHRYFLLISEARIFVNSRFPDLCLATSALFGERFSHRVRLNCPFFFPPFFAALSESFWERGCSPQASASGSCFFLRNLSEFIFLLRPSLYPNLTAFFSPLFCFLL